jgi:hypothetical protein
MLRVLVICAVVLGGLSLPIATAGAGVSVGLPTPASSTYAWANNRNLRPALTTFTGEVGIDAGNYDSLLIEPSGHVLEFGGNSTGARAYTVASLSHVVATADADQYFIAISSPTPIVSGRCPDSTVWRWSDGKAATKVTALDGLGVVEVAGGADHQFALTCTGKVYVWGVGPLAMGSSGHAFKEPTLNPYLTALTGGTSVGVLIDAGSDIGGMLVKGRVYMWGNNAQGQCGCGTSGGFMDSPTPVKQTVSFKTISVGGDQSYNGQVLAIDGSGRAWCWGAGLDGQCGLGTSTNVDVPTRVPGQTSVAQVAAGGAYSLFVGTNGDLRGCGDIHFGAGAKGSTANQLSSVKILSGVAAVSAGAEHVLVIGTRSKN